jgi:hypothetical protein
VKVSLALISLPLVAVAALFAALAGNMLSGSAWGLLFWFLVFALGAVSWIGLASLLGALTGKLAQQRSRGFWPTYWCVAGVLVLAPLVLVGFALG